MEYGDSRAIMEQIWEDVTSSLSHDSNFFTPPLSLLDPPEQGTRSEIDSDEDLHEPHTPSSDTLGTPQNISHKDRRPIVKIAGTDTFTPLNSPWPSPLFSGRAPSSHRLHKSKSNILARTEIQFPNQLEHQMTEGYQGMGEPARWRNDSLVAAAEADHDSSRLVTHKRPPPPIGSDVRVNTTQHRTILCEPLLGITKQINLELLRCSALLPIAHPECLVHADKALTTAEKAEAYHLVSKSQFYRGLALMELRRYKEASDAFTKAASVRDWSGKVWSCKNAAERMVVIEKKFENKTIVLVEEDLDEFWEDDDR